MYKEPQPFKAHLKRWLWIIILQLITLAFILLIRYPQWIKEIQQLITGWNKSL